MGEEKLHFCESFTLSFLGYWVGSDRLHYGRFIINKFSFDGGALLLLSGFEIFKWHKMAAKVEMDLGATCV